MRTRFTAANFCVYFVINLVRIAYGNDDEPKSAEKARFRRVRIISVLYRKAERYHAFGFDAT